MPSQYFLFPPCPLNGSRWADGDAGDETEGLGSDATLFLTERSWFSSCCSSSLTRSLNRSISLSRPQSVYAPCTDVGSGPDCVWKCPHLTRPPVATLSTSALAIGAWVIVVTLDAVDATPVASFGDLAAFLRSGRRCRGWSRRPRLIMTMRTGGQGASECCEHDDTSVGSTTDNTHRGRLCRGMWGFVKTLRKALIYHDVTQATEVR